jgi:UDP-glucose 4-epimerase
MNVKKKTYLVTGGAGFIGSHLVDHLIARGHRVLVVDNLSTGRKEHINARAFFHRGDIRDKKNIAKWFRGVNGVFHLAALARIQPSFEKPEEYVDVNVLGTKNILELAKKYQIKRVVYSASSSAYGHQTKLLREDMALSPQALSPYSSTKRVGEMLMRDMGSMTKGPETVCLRYFNVYGPRQTTAADGPYATVVGIFLDQWKRKEPFSLVPFPGKPLGAMRRSFTHVNDVVEANLRAMNSPRVGAGEIINIGTKKSMSIKELAFLIGGKNYQLIKAPDRKGEVFETHADIRKAKNLLGWQPRVTLTQGIERLKGAS